MSENGFIQIYHDLLRHPSVVSAPLAYRWVLITIIDRACYEECQQDDHGKLINLKPGQLVCTERKLAEYAGVSKNDVHRALVRFSEVKILNQEVNHTKNVITILWGVKYKTCEPIKEPTVNQLRTRKEEYKKEITTTAKENAAAEIFQCLTQIQENEVSLAEKIRITKKYSGQEERVIDAVAYISQSGFKPASSLLKALNGALLHSLKPSAPTNAEKKKWVEKNLEHSDGYPVERLKNKVIKFPTGETLNLETEPNEFKKQFNKMLRLA